MSNLQPETVIAVDARGWQSVVSRDRAAGRRGVEVRVAVVSQTGQRWAIREPMAGPVLSALPPYVSLGATKSIKRGSNAVSTVSGNMSLEDHVRLVLFCKDASS